MPKEISALTFKREVDMYQPLLKLFSRFGITVAEVPFFGKRIDLLFGTPSLSSLYAVETKLHDWRSAFKQAALNQLAAQRSYVAVPSKLAARLAEEEKDQFRRYDVGLIAVALRAKILVPPKKNGCFSLRHHHVIKNTLKKAKNPKAKRIGAIADAIADRSQTLIFLQTWAD